MGSANTKTAISDSSSAENDFAKPEKDGSRFKNPLSFDNWDGVPGPWSVIKWRLFEKDEENVPDEPADLDKTIPVHNLTKFEPSNPDSKLTASWLGHATMLVQMEGIRFITDPIWAHRASLFSFVGPERYRPPPMSIENLPKLDFAVISHDHYDHLDKEAVNTIQSMNPEMRWFIPMNMKKWMASIGIENDESHPDRVTEMSWGENSTITTSESQFTIWCLPAQHWGQRGIFDRNERLWSGWAVIGPERRFYYSGDTGNCDKEFKKIGEQLGPFDLAAIPIGAYAPRWFMKSQHINVDEAVQLHKLIKSRFSVGIHWGTYHMGSYEYYLEPRERLEEIMNTNGSALAPFVTLPMGHVWDETNK